MLFVLLYPPAQLIGETDDLETVGEAPDVELAYAGGRGPTERVRFPQLGSLTYSMDRYGRTMLMVQGLGPYALRGDSWVAWRLPTTDERRAWDAHKAAVAGIIAPRTPDAKRNEPC